MYPFTGLDLVALAWFLGIWITYAAVIESTRYGGNGLNSLMDRYHEMWTRRMLERDMRMVDMQIISPAPGGTSTAASAHSSLPSRISAGSSVRRCSWSPRQSCGRANSSRTRVAPCWTNDLALLSPAQIGWQARRPQSDT
jgi:hypothetical protein